MIQPQLPPSIPSAASAQDVLKMIPPAKGNQSIRFDFLPDLLEFLQNTESPTVLKIGIPNCGPCKIVETNLLPQFAARFPNINIVRVDGFYAPAIPEHFGTDLAPAFFLFKPGSLKPLSSKIGGMGLEKFCEWVNENCFDVNQQQPDRDDGKLTKLHRKK